MMKRIKVAVLGGSSLSTPLLVEAIAKGSPQAAYDVVLAGRDAKRLGLVQRVSQELLRGRAVDVRVSTTLHMEQALEGADFCINQIRPGGLEGRAYDETFPRQFGIPGEETLGPGGFSSAIRSLPVVMDQCRLMEQVAPDVVLLNLTNPCSLLQYAIRRSTKVNVIGLCELPIIMMERIAGVLGVERSELDFDLAGMNHHSWVTSVRQAGQERLPDVLSQIERLPKLGVDPKLVKALGAIPSPFMRFYFHPDRILAETSGKPVRAQELIELGQAMLEDFQQWQPGTGGPPASLRTRGAAWYDKIVAPVLLAFAEERDALLPLNIENNGVLPFLPRDAIVETLVEIKRGQMQKPDSVTTPIDLRALLTSHCAFEMLAAQAVMERDREKALRAILSNPLVKSFEQAQKIVEVIFDLSIKR